MKGSAKEISDIDLSTTLAYARFYVSKGFSVIPVAHGTKRPALPSWREFQKRRATDAELKAWFGDCAEDN